MHLNSGNAWPNFISFFHCRHTRPGEICSPASRARFPTLRTDSQQGVTAPQGLSDSPDSNYLIYKSKSKKMSTSIMQKLSGWRILLSRAAILIMWGRPLVCRLRCLWLRWESKTSCAGRSAFFLFLAQIENCCFPRDLRTASGQSRCCLDMNKSSPVSRSGRSRKKSPSIESRVSTVSRKFVSRIEAPFTQ